MRFDVAATCDTNNAGTSAANNLIPPRHSSSFIRRFDTFLNGQQVTLSGLEDYGSLAHLEKNLTCGADKTRELNLFRGRCFLKEKHVFYNLYIAALTQPQTIPWTYECDYLKAYVFPSLSYNQAYGWDFLHTVLEAVIHCPQ
jgi:hypothetical protein